MKRDLTIMSGAGNVFVVAPTEELPPTLIAPYSHQLCQAALQFCNHPADGVLLVDQGESELIVHYMNPDGTSGMMCGNGARCAVAFAQSKGWIHSTCELTLAGERYQAIIRDDGKSIAVEFPPPRSIIERDCIILDGAPLDYAYVDVGSDHVVIDHRAFRTWLQSHNQELDFLNLASRVRSHTTFPHGANVNLYRVTDRALHLITYERGVERITGACGTGALASAVIAWIHNQYSGTTIPIIPPSGEELSVTILTKQHSITGLILSGPASVLGTVTVELPIEQQ